MVYAERYFAEYSQEPKQTMNFVPALVHLSFRYAGFTGTPTELEVYAPDPLTIEMADGGGSIDQLMVTKRANIRLRTHDIATAESFFVSDDRAIQVIAYVDKTGTGNAFLDCFFHGWVSPVDLRYAYQKPPFELQISAACGLSTLKDRPFLDKQGNRFTGLISDSEVLRTAIWHIGFVDTLVSGDNLYEEAELASCSPLKTLVPAELDPLYQTMEDAETYTKDTNEVMSCYEAAAKVLRKKRLRLCQQNFEWWVLRVSEMGGGWDAHNTTNQDTIATRLHNDTLLGAPPAGYTSVNLNAVTSLTGDLRVKEQGPKTGLRLDVPGIRIEQSFGRIKSKIPNGDFGLYDPATHFPTGWQGHSLVADQLHREGSGTEADPFRMIIYGGSDNYVNGGQGAMYNYIEYPEGSRERTKVLKRTVKLQARLTNVRAAQLWCTAYVYFPSAQIGGVFFALDNEWKYLQGMKTREVVTTRFNNTQVVDGHTVAKPGWFDITWELPTVDYRGDPMTGVRWLSLYLGMAEKLDETDPNVPEKIEYRNVRMEIEQEGLNLTGAQRTIVKPGQLVKDATLSFDLGDVPSAAQPEDHLGTTYRRASYPAYEPTVRWGRPDFYKTSTGKLMPIIDWLAEDYARQLMFATPLFDGDLVGDMPYGPMTVLRIFDGPEMGKMILTRWKWQTRSNVHSVTAQRLMTDSDLSAFPGPAKEWQTPDGPVIMNSDAAGVVVAPVAPLRQLIRGIVSPLRDALAKLNPPRLLPLVPGYAPILPVPPLGTVPHLRILADGKPIGIVLGTQRQLFDVSSFINK